MPAPSVSGSLLAASWTCGQKVVPREHPLPGGRVKSCLRRAAVPPGRLPSRSRSRHGWQLPVTMRCPGLPSCFRLVLMAQKPPTPFPSAALPLPQLPILGVSPPPAARSISLLPRSPLALVLGGAAGSAAAADSPLACLPRLLVPSRHRRCEEGPQLPGPGLPQIPVQVTLPHPPSPRARPWPGRGLRAAARALWGARLAARSGAAGPSATRALAASVVRSGRRRWRRSAFGSEGVAGCWWCQGNGSGFCFEHTELLEKGNVSQE